MTELKHPYISVEKDGVLSYGGTQTWSESRVIRRCGCGVIGSMDVLIYLSKYNARCGGVFPAALLGDTVSERDYDEYSRRLCLRYMPVVPPFGMNGLTLAAGLELAFRHYKMPMRARWGVRRSELFGTIEEMLSADIPVILSVGPNFPRVWRKDKATLYVMRSDGLPRAATATHAHFLTVTGIDGEWLQVSSWGHRFFIFRAEYEEYVTHSSNGLLSSIVHISET